MVSVVLSSDGFHDADGLDGAQLSDLARVVESYRDAVIAQENAAFKPPQGED